MICPSQTKSQYNARIDRLLGQLFSGNYFKIEYYLHQSNMLTTSLLSTKLSTAKYSNESLFRYILGIVFNLIFFLLKMW